MGSDLFVVTSEASANATTLFAVNQNARTAHRHHIVRVPGGAHELGAVVQTAAGPLPQARETATVLGVQSSGKTGFTQGVNEHRVAVGVTNWQSRLPYQNGALSGPDLVRLTLERSHNANHAIDILTDLIGRYGQGSEADGERCDHIFLIADGEAAYVLEATGRYWAQLECRHTRVVTDVAMIRQDWCRLAPGLAEHVIHQGWWQEDGRKVDFVRCMGDVGERGRAAQRRWGQASLALAQQHGAIDTHYLRRMLADQNELSAGAQSPSASHTARFAGAEKPASSLLVELDHSSVPVVVWIAFGGPAVGLYFPLVLVGELPGMFTAAHPEVPTIEDRTHSLDSLASDPRKDRQKLTHTLEKLQTRFDLDVEDFLVKAHDCLQRGNSILLSQLATAMMASHVELFEKEYRRLFNIEEKTPHPAPETEEVLFFA